MVTINVMQLLAVLALGFGGLVVGWALAIVVIMTAYSRDIKRSPSYRPARQASRAGSIISFLWIAACTLGGGWLGFHLTS